jgi:hypothetical protein
MEVNVEDLAINEIRELLLEAGAKITLTQAEQLAQFIAQTGGLDDALEAVQQLAEQRRAA